MEKMIYAILSVKQDHERLLSVLPGIRGIGGVELAAISLDGITAVVSDIDSAALITNRSNALEYAGVIETLARDFTLLPVRFGSVKNSADAVVNMLEANYIDFKNNLQTIDGKVEFGLKIFCDTVKLMAELGPEPGNEPDTGNGSANQPGPSVYRDYVNKKLKEHRLGELMLTYVDSVRAAISARLSGLAAVTKFKKMAPATNIIDAVFLLEKRKKEGLVAIVGELQTEHPGLNFMLTGPWPAYNFVEINIK
ncbi:MAG: GvpL/GvpF family gas vesicle protein [Bacteroidota bacterium]